MPIQLPKIVRGKKRLGRGIGSRGAKSGQGQKGQKSRAGYSSKAGFEGGQTPLYMRLPKGRGSKQKFRPQGTKPIAVSVSHLNGFKEGAIVGPGQLRKAGFLQGRIQQVKFIGAGPVHHKVTVRTHGITSGAKTAIEKAGGKVEIISQAK
ncbi:MAG: 50S ribosomal protein L15 [Candidatus Andersenbacteria bacterium]